MLIKRKQGKCLLSHGILKDDDMSAKKNEKLTGRCPDCNRRVALDYRGRIMAHLIKEPSYCGGQGGEPKGKSL